MLFMAKVKVLIKGYVEDIDPVTGKVGRACSTITLVRDAGVTMIVDPGTLNNQMILIGALKKEGLTVNDINYVCITHSHVDHYRNIGMFPGAKTLERWGIWDKCDASNWVSRFSDDIEILKTPGHNYDGMTLLVKTDIGTVAICGDVFWMKDYPKSDPYATDPERLITSREKVLKMADWIIPGHDDIYKVDK